jgi:hypothetical protein
MSQKPKRYISNIPELIAEWNWEKNNELGLDPSKLTRGSSKKAHWICKKGHMWIARISSRCGTQGNNCPYCSNYKVWAGDNDLNTTHPQLSKEWHPTNNGTLKPTDIVPVEKRKQSIWKANFGGKQYAWNSPETAILRSKTFPGIAKAMAEQWTSNI